MGQCAGEEIAQKLRELLASRDQVNIMFGAAPSQNETLATLVNAGGIDWSRVNAFHMDEYVGLPTEHPAGFGNYLNRHIFSLLPFRSVNLINGGASDIDAEAARYSELLEKMPLDICVLGIGENGHIAFNDPGSSLTSRTRQKTLTMDTIIANSRFFDNDVNKVPKTSVTVGVGTVLDAKEVLIMVNGHNKARALQQAVEGAVNQMWTITALQLHPKGIIVCDEAACADLKVGTYNYFKDIEKDHLCPCSLLK